MSAALLVLLALVQTPPTGSRVAESFLERIERRFHERDVDTAERLAQVTNRFDEMADRFAKVSNRFNQLADALERLRNLPEQVDERTQATNRSLLDRLNEHRATLIEARAEAAAERKQAQAELAAARADLVESLARLLWAVVALASVGFLAVVFLWLKVMRG